MAFLQVAQVGHPVLRQPTREVGREELATPEIQGFIDDLIETMREANGAGLAANQVYRSVRVCVIEVNDNPRYPYKPNVPLTVLVNPRLTPIGDETFENFEGCLSVPNLRGVVVRHAVLRVQAIDRHGNPIDQTVRGITAGTFAHECDHLDGKLFLDRVEDTRTLCTWKEFARNHEQAVRDHVRQIVEKYGS